MNAAHLHLLVNHLPILGAVFAVPLLALALWRRHEPGILYGAALLCVVAGAGAIIADETGEGAEESVENLPGVVEPLIHEHEEQAEIAIVLALATAALAVGTAGVSARAGKVHALATGITLSAAIATSGSMALVGWAGGQIRHTEIREAGHAVGSGAEARDVRSEAGEEREEHER